MSIDTIIQLINADAGCVVFPAEAMPALPVGYSLPEDLRRFYEITGGVSLFPSADYAITIVRPTDFVRANPIIVGAECRSDRSFDWFIVGQSDSQYITIDLNEQRKGTCYDSFWDSHGVVGVCAIVATSFSQLLSSLYESEGRYWYWLRNDFRSLGDAYDG